MSRRALTVEHISKRYRLGARVKREVWALNDVSFEAAPGTILGVIGPNGAGKTTLLKVIGRVTRPTSGVVHGYGRVVPLLALGAGFRPELSGRENILMNGAMYGISAAEIEEHLDEIIEFAGIAEFIDAPVKRYSSGMYLRLAFSVAVNMRPDILLADEVLAVGDLEFQERCLERVKAAGQAGMCVLFVSHDMEAIRRLCDRVLWLNEGKIVGVGSPDEITSAYERASWAVGTTNRKRRQAGSGNDAAEILFARLEVGGKEVGAARVSDTLTVVIGVRTLQPGLEVRPVLDVKARGVVAFRSVAPELVKIDAPGLYTARVTIPPHLLAETAYGCDATVAITRGDERMSIILYNALSFHVYDTNEAQSARGTFGGNIHGVVRPRLQWEVAPAKRALEGAVR